MNPLPLNESTDRDTLKKFDLDLQFGKAGEKWLCLLADEWKMEVKRERDMWVRTGNLFIEYEYKGQPSGVCATTAKYWGVILSFDGRTQGTIIFPTDVLIHNLRRLSRERKVKTVMGGDDGQSKGILLPLALVGEAMLPVPEKDENNR